MLRVCYRSILLTKYLEKCIIRCWLTSTSSDKQARAKESLSRCIMRILFLNLLSSMYSLSSSCDPRFLVVIYLNILLTFLYVGAIYLIGFLFIMLVHLYPPCSLWYLYVRSSVNFEGQKSQLGSMSHQHFGTRSFYVDLMVCCSSFSLTNGQVIKCSIYRSFYLDL